MAAHGQPPDTHVLEAGRTLEVQNEVLDEQPPQIPTPPDEANGE